METRRVRYVVEVVGYVLVGADSDKEAVDIARQMVGVGISIAANMHSPPGVSINSNCEVVEVGGIVKPKKPTLVTPAG